MKVTLISRPSIDPVQLCGIAAATCTRSSDPVKALKAALASGHVSVLEQASYTFRIEEVSRVLMAQLTRHRIASFAIESQRYTGVVHHQVVPDTLARADLVDDLIDLIKRANAFYAKALNLGAPQEDVRYYTFQAEETTITMTMNARELRHFFSLRCCNRAQWEIREMACKMLEIMQQEFPLAFADAGPECLRSGCPEGKRSCGKPWKKEEATHDNAGTGKG